MYIQVSSAANYSPLQCWRACRHRTCVCAHGRQMSVFSYLLRSSGHDRIIHMPYC